MFEIREKSSSNQRRRASLNQIFKSSFMDSTAHGLPKIVSRDNQLVKVFWLICFLASALTCVLTIRSSVREYFNYETVTKTEVVQEIPTLFPSVSICNENFFFSDDSIEYVNRLLIQNGILGSTDQHGANFTSIYSKLSAKNFIKLKYFATTNVKNEMLVNSNDVAHVKFGLKMQDMLLSCEYNCKPCVADDFEWYIDSLYYKWDPRTIQNHRQNTQLDCKHN
jgi:hypothetical protein